MVVDYFSRLNFLSSIYSKSSLASYLGISRQLLNYYFNQSRFPKGFLTKQRKRQISYYYFKGIKRRKTLDGYRKIYKQFSFNLVSMFKQILMFEKGLIGSNHFLQGRFVFEQASGNIYSPSTEVYSFKSGGFQLFKKEVKQIYRKYNIVDREVVFSGSSSVYFDDLLGITFFY